jgi:hypothetical protein
MQFDFGRRKKQYRDVFLSPNGEAVLKDLLKFCMYDSPTYVIGDSHQTAYNEGMRRVALRIISIAGMDEKTIEQLKRQ